ncbi:MFS transporter [Psychromonas hadalis]|uniref:MFS transporter n=1 Tax=Psychromonas hadalis TaxID=211669 RepID=UPI0003B73EB5|nr:MFS transporter [Psychromonas hadalis]
MPILSRTFYLFSAIHAFLLGLLPIFIPVILWDKGLNVADIAWFIVLSAVGFLGALYAWDRLRAKAKWVVIIALSFILQMMLVGLLVWDSLWLLLSIGALINGAAGCFYWSTQRLLFQAITSDKNSGNTFGNFQILVVFSLKFGILMGSFMLDSDYIKSLIVISFCASLAGFYALTKLLRQTEHLLTASQPGAFSLSTIFAFKDNFHSKKIFMVDGLFLFLESYFWVLTLYMLTKENLMKLGLLIVVLSVLLALIFFVVKKVIDRTNAQRIFILSIFGYALSWLLRGELSLQNDDITLYGGMLLIAFLSSFFRLVFNKRFYDIARGNQPIYYIVCKSYYSQFMIIVFFSVIALLASMGKDPLNQLQILYDVAIPLVFVYVLYGVKKSAKKGVESGV